MPNIIKNVCHRYGLTVISKLSLGNICSSVYRVIDSNNRQLVLKFGVTKETIAEIKMNRRGYEKMDQYNLRFFSPEIVAYENTGVYALLLMEYCGEDFFTHIKKVSSPEDLYNRLKLEMKVIYLKSLGKGQEGKQMISGVIDKVREQYENYIYMRFDAKRLIAKKIYKLDSCINVGQVNSFCFSNWDFTPEDVYLTPIGIRYSDPHEDILGIPIIDIACFAGVAMTYDLPGSKKGYLILEEFATKELSSMMKIEKETAIKLFYIGRLLQCLLSARFRGESDVERARELFVEGIKYLEKII